MKFKDYKNCWEIASKPECYRVGQWAFNFVYDTYPEIANKLRATDFTEMKDSLHFGQR
jgi:hypothetical protein